MDAYVADFKSKNGIPRTEDSVQLFQMGLIEITEKAEKDAVEVMGVSPETFQQSLVAHQDSREVRMILQAMHQSSQTLMAGHGFSQAAM
eukprot:gene3692-4607_t